MPTADEVIVEFQAQVGRYQADLRRAQQVFERTTGAQQARMESFERQMQRSSGQISSTLKGLAGAFATAFTGRELVGLIDSFTRLQNNLRVAGLEGRSLADVQRQLLDLSSRYGASVEGLSSVFLKANLAQQSLGASTEQIIQLNEIVAASLKVTGLSAAEAQGALLQLGQALGSGVVRAEEFNSILEGAFPLAQAAARGIEGYAGDVAKLRIAIADGAITSREFFEGVLRGGTQTIAEAEKATLTLSGAMEALTSQLTIYFGEAGKGSGATEALASAIEALADNLDTIIPILATLAAGLGVGFVTNAARARIAAAATATTFNAMTLQTVRGTTALGAMGVAARGAGASMLSAFGGPVGIAITALAVGIGYLVTEMESAEQAAARLRGETEALAKTNDLLATRLHEAGVKVGNLGRFADQTAGKIDGLTTSMGAAVGEAISLIATLNKLDFLETGAEVARLEARRNLIRNPDPLQGPGQAAQAISNAIGINQRDAEVAAIDRQIEELMRGLELRTAAAKIGLDPSGAPTGEPTAAGKSPKATSSPKGRSGPTADEIAARAAEDLARLQQEELQARLALTTNAEERADLERQLLASEYKQRRSQIETADLTAKQKAAQIAILEKLYGVETAVNETGEITVSANKSLYGLAIIRAEQEQVEREAADLAHDRHQAELDALRLQYDLVDTEADRRRIALDILDAEDRYLKSKEQAILASDTATDAEKARARLALDALNSTAGARRASVERQHEGPLGRYARYSSDPAQDVEEAVARKLESVNQGISDALSDALGTDDQFVKDLFSIFLDQVIFRPLAEALDQAGGGNLLGGLFSSVTGAIFGGGKAIGGPVRAGVPYEVGESGRELFVPQQNGVIVPNHRLTSQAGTTVISSPKFDLRGAVVTAELYADMERISRANAAKAAGKAYQQSMKDAPGRVRSAQRYGR
ncbi:MAG: tape measure protein [Pseudomonadota bacterium]|nr:tape measure protein [Pseudomonadota bacterium]